MAAMGCQFVLKKFSCLQLSEAWREMRTFLSFNATDDISRVKLSVQTHSTDDYINANYMPVSRWLLSRPRVHLKRSVSVCAFDGD